jgi:hypothetical protein
MATTVDTLLVRIEADMRDVRRDLARLEKETSTHSKKISRSLGGIGTAAKAVLGGVLIQQLARGTLALTKFASDMEEMSAMSEAVFGSFIHSVRNELDQFGEAVGRSRFDLEAMAASVQDTFVPLGFARGQAADLSVALTKLAVDVASFKNESEQATMQAFQSALVGNHEAVRRFGIVITEAELKAELFRMGITKNAKDVDAATKVQARLNLIMAGTVDAQGDAARTSGSYANQTRALDAQLKLLAADVGNELLPVMKDLVALAIEGTKGFRDFLAAIGIGGSETQKAARATQERMIAEQNLADVMQRVRDMSMSSGAANRLLHDAQMELAEAALAEEAAIEALMKSKGLLNDATEEQVTNNQNVKKELSDVEKFVIEQARQQEILMLKLTGASEATIAQKEAQHALGKEYLDNQELVDREIKTTTDLTAQIAAQTEATAKLKEIEDKRREAQEGGVQQLEDLKNQHMMLTAELNGQTEAQLAQLEAAIQHGNLEDGVSERILAQIAANHKLKAQIDEKTKAQNASNDSIQKGVDYVASFNAEETVLLETQQALNDALAAGKINSDEFGEAQNMLALELKRLDPMFAATEQAAQRAGDAIADSLADAVVSGKFNADMLKNIFKDLIKTLIAEAIKTFVIRKIMSAFMGGFGGGGSVGGSSGFGGDSFMAFAGGGRIPARATGGPVLVGERGPELFIPHSAGNIKNKMDTKNMLQGGGAPVNVYQTIQVDTGVSQTVKTEMMNMLPRFKAETMQAVIDGKRRGKAISKVFA